jgi:uncharacterized membrane protein
VTPEARMIAAAAFGVVLIAAGEYARGGRLLSDDPRIGQALVGAGIAILYAAAYGSHLLFELIGNGTAFALMLLITVGALALSLRHGAPTAFMGLIGGFLTPTIVGNPSAGALPVLTYLAVLDVAIFAIAWRRSWAGLPPRRWRQASPGRPISCSSPPGMRWRRGCSQHCSASPHRFRERGRGGNWH